jgi:hypothetical protein
MLAGRGFRGEGAAMTRDDLRRHLTGMAAGEVFFLPYDIYEGMCRPDSSEQAHRDECEALARDCGCTVAMSPEAQQVRFTKGG